MKNILFLTLIASTTLWSCNSANTAEKKANIGELPTFDAPIHIKNDFENGFLTKFKQKELPLKITNDITIQDTIPAKDVMQYILATADKEKMTALQDFYGENEAITRKGLEDRFLNQDKNIFMVLNFGYGQRYEINPNFYTLTFHIIPTFMEGSNAYTYLANFDKTGKMLDAIQIASNAGYVDMQQHKITEITAKGRIKVESKNIKRGGFEDGSKDFTEFAYAIYKLTEAGKLLVEEERYTGLSGNFAGKESAETFKIEQYAAHIQVVYQAAPDAFLQEELEVVQFNKDTRTIIAKHREKDLQFVLTYDQDMKKIICKTSTGKTLNLSRKG